ncbi:esterase/lipase family protein [Streptomyces sp. 3211]|uniref:esterase/lipase family protein n=1 Tax=Streptomyces sp. 3211 TaxID=1964449 RepID=UPI0009A518F6|nr:triacylglycerol lipase [Streptomyces sp. 3211]
MHAYLLRLVPAVALALAVCAGPAAARPLAAPHAPAEPDPVVFVHGWNSDGSVWNTFAERLRADGRPADHLYRWTYPTSQSNATTASQLASVVDGVLAATGAAKVDLVTHSMGALPSRHYLKNLGGDAKVDAWVSLAGPNHGTDTAHFCGQVSCIEMRPGSAFLNALNAVDETPGSTRYATWWSPCDLVINPDRTVALSGAVNTRTPCLLHSAFLTDAGVYAQVRDHIG